MSVRAYVGVSRDHLRTLASTGVLPSAGLLSAVADGDDEEAEAEAMASAADLAAQEHGEHLAVAVDVAAARHGEPLADDVPIADVASFAVGDDLAWYATQELDALL